VTAIVTRGNAANLHLPDETVDLIVTSPPYFGLRSYQDGGEHYAGQVGDEATPTEYLDALIACTAEWMRVLKPGGSIFVNLGDKYAARQEAQNSAAGRSGRRPLSVTAGYAVQPATRHPQAKSLIGLPWRYAIRCIDELGLILRAEIVWAKPNGLPESVTDRVRRSTSRCSTSSSSPGTTRRSMRCGSSTSSTGAALRKRRTAATPGVPGQPRRNVKQARRRRHRRRPRANPLGKLPGSVWTIPTAPLKVPASLGIDHFAAYPPELVRRIVLGWSPREVCTACGEGRRPVS
jgi:hypothetical protein